MLVCCLVIVCLFGGCVYVGLGCVSCLLMFLLRGGCLGERCLFGLVWLGMLLIVCVVFGFVGSWFWYIDITLFGVFDVVLGVIGCALRGWLV